VLRILALASSGDDYSYKPEVLRVTERNFSPSGTEVTDLSRAWLVCVHSRAKVITENFMQPTE